MSFLNSFSSLWMHVVGGKMLIFFPGNWWNHASLLSWSRQMPCLRTIWFPWSRVTAIVKLDHDLMLVQLLFSNACEKWCLSLTNCSSSRWGVYLFRYFFTLSVFLKRGLPKIVVSIDIYSHWRWWESAQSWRETEVQLWSKVEYMNQEYFKGSRSDSIRMLSTGDGRVTPLNWTSLLME